MALGRTKDVTGRPIACCPPRFPQRPLAFQQTPVRHEEREADAGARHLVLRHAQEVGLRDLVLEYDQDDGLHAVVVSGPLGGVVAQVGREPRRHGRRPHGPALPLEEEGRGGCSVAQYAAGVGVDGAQLSAVAEVAGCTAGRVELKDLLRARVSLPRQHGDEPVDGPGVFGVPEQLAAAGAANRAPVRSA